MTTPEAPKPGTEYPHLLGCIWSLAKWSVGLTVFFVASEILERALGLGHYWTGALILLFVVAGYVAGYMDAQDKAARTALAGAGR